MHFMENKQNPKSSSSNRHYFVNEGGDSTLFSKTGKVLVGTEGCSRFFILGLLDVPNPVVLKDRFDELRARLISDSYFKNVPSMQPNERKTAIAFHAKDDLPEVRRDVFIERKNKARDIGLCEPQPDNHVAWSHFVPGNYLYYTIKINAISSFGLGFFQSFSKVSIFRK